MGSVWGYPGRSFFIGSRLRAYLLTTAAGRWWYGLRPSCALLEELGRDGSAISFPLPVYTADANGGLCIERRCVDALGAWGPPATNKLRRVYTGALLATTIITYQRG